MNEPNIALFDLVWSLIAGLGLALIVWAVVKVIRAPGVSDAAKALWVAIALLIPWVGALVALFWVSERRRSKPLEVSFGGESVRPPGSKRA